MRKVLVALPALFIALVLGGCGSATAEHVGLSGFTVDPPAIQQEATEDEPLPETGSTAPEEKPEANINANASGFSASKPSSGGVSVGNTASNPPAHEHRWVYHEAETKTVYTDEGKWIGWYVCGHCGTKTYSSADAQAHQRAEALETGTCYAYGTDGYWESKMVETTEVVREAYYSCSCGATK